MMAPAERYRAWAVAAAVALIVGALLAFWVWHALGGPRYGGISTVDETISRQTDVPAPEITSSVSVSQTFVASDDDLTEVQAFLAAYSRKNTAPVVLSLSEGTGPPIRSVQTDPATIFDNAYHAFVFDPIPDSRRKTYTATLTSPTGQPGNAFTAWISSCDCYPDGLLSIGGTPHPDQELVMRVDYHHQGVVTWRELVDRMSQYKPWIVTGAGLVLLGVLSMALALAALGGVTLSVTPRREEEWARPIWIASSVVAAAIVVLVTGTLSGI